MNMKRTANPLRKRILRELFGDWKKYLLVSLFLLLTIGFVSGMYVANESMMTSARLGVTRYALEDGHFELNQKADPDFLAVLETGEMADIYQYYLDKAQSEIDSAADAAFRLYQTFNKNADEESLRQISEEAKSKVIAEIDSAYAKAEEKYGLNDPEFSAVNVSVYENFFRNETEDKNCDGSPEGTVRVYRQTEKINLASLLKGRFPENAQEIAIDRMHASNAGIQIGDTIRVGGQDYSVVGLLAYVNYATLHENSTDLIFDAIGFDVAMVTEEGFDRLDSALHYAYAWHYAEAPEDEIQEKEASDHFLKALLTQTITAGYEIEDYMPRYANPAINFATEDMGSDMAMGGILLDILIIIIAFIFAVTISNTISRESSAIGTLRALGYTKGELIMHYLSMPLIVTFLSAAIGNLLGYTLFKQVVVSMYYNSYSLPAYETYWSRDAFLKTTLVPVILMLVVNLLLITRVMQHTPLEFLRHDLKKTKRKKAMRLPRWSFLARFRLRIIFQNLSNYLILFVGILFISVLLAMAVGMPSTLDFYQNNVQDMMFAKYQYVLTDFQDDSGQTITTETSDAETFSMTTLLKKSDSLNEEISVYGVSESSRYISIEDLSELSDSEGYISDSFAEKYDLRIGDTITLTEKYADSSYSFTVAGIYEHCVSLALFLPAAQYTRLFDLEPEAFTGYFSDTEITDLPEDSVAAVITEKDITKMADQLDHSMGAYMTYFQYLCILLSAVLIYLLTKLIIEKNELPISMTKILGYHNREIASLYLLSTTIVVILADAVSVLIGTSLMGLFWKLMMKGYSGYVAFIMNPTGYVKIFIFILIGYLIVMFFDFRRIRRIPMDQALKQVE
ncbi:MAG: ABC transporter permease [Eubacteriales bacterium]|nr:ABC transporter permease [Eubacteriales bacterium]